MERLTIYEILEFLHWLQPTLKLIKHNHMFMNEREEIFKITAERIELLLMQISRDYDVKPPAYNAGEITWLEELYEKEDTRIDNDKHTDN